VFHCSNGNGLIHIPWDNCYKKKREMNENIDIEIKKERDES
jgi:hypothetical protein